MGTGRVAYTHPKGQVGSDPLVLKQCKTTGMAALIQTIELAAPKESFVTVTQGANEKLMLEYLARNNCNANCRRIIEALPGDPSISQMAEPCAKIDTLGHKMAALTTVVEPTLATALQPALANDVQPALATAVQPVWVVPQGRQQQQGNAYASKKQGKKVQKMTTPRFLCGQCERPNHFSELCKATVHTNSPCWAREMGSRA